MPARRRATGAWSGSTATQRDDVHDPVPRRRTAETQNVLGSRQVDLLQVTDWFFPRGIDHHHLLAGVPAASFVMQKVARHVAGLGRLPDEVAPTATARRESIDVLVIGAGGAGLDVAQRLTRRLSREQILVVDEAPHPGGSLRALGPRNPRCRLGRAGRAGYHCGGHLPRGVLLVRQNRGDRRDAARLDLSDRSPRRGAPFSGQRSAGRDVGPRGGDARPRWDRPWRQNCARRPRGLRRRIRRAHAVFGCGRSSRRLAPSWSPRTEGLGSTGAIATRSEETATPKRHRVDALLVDAAGRPIVRTGAASWRVIRFAASARGYACNRRRGRAANALCVHRRPAEGRGGRREASKSRRRRLPMMSQRLLANRLGPYVPPAGLSLDEPSEQAKPRRGKDDVEHQHEFKIVAQVRPASPRRTARGWRRSRCRR